MSRRIQVGQVAIGDGAPVSVQSMTNTPTKDAAQTLAQIRALAACGCENLGNRGNTRARKLSHKCRSRLNSGRIAVHTFRTRGRVPIRHSAEITENSDRPTAVTGDS